MTRRSERELRKEIDEMAESNYRDLEPLTLAEVISYDLETVDEEAGIVRVVETGKLRRRGNVQDELLAGMKAAHADDE